MSISPPETISTATLLINSYPPLLTQANLADIFGQHVQTIRRIAKAGKLPFVDVSITPAERRYRLSDVIAYLENPPLPPPTPSTPHRGRPVGARNKPKKSEMSCA